MPEARCRMVVKSATKPRFGQQNVMAQVTGAEEAGVQRGTFSFQVAGEEFFERGDEFVVTLVPADAAEEPAEEPAADETPEAKPEEIPPVPDVKVADLAAAVAKVNDVATLKAWKKKDGRTTAAPIYDARIAELEGDS